MKYLFTSLVIALFVGCTPQTSSDHPLGLHTNLDGIAFVNQRIFLNMQTADGASLRFFTDTGGGRIIYPETVEKLGLPIDTMAQGQQVMEMVNLGPLFAENDLPMPLGVHFVFRQEAPFKGENDGMLGAHWFGNKIWHFDYLNKTLATVDSVHWEKANPNQIVEIGFMEDSLGNNLTHFPRIPIIVEGDTIQTLFDSGATIYLNQEGQQKLQAPSIGGSFMAAQIFDTWRMEHPEWDFIAKGDSLVHEDLIQVPEVTIGPYTVGPVWFARREDHNFAQWMSQWMDQTIYGAIGGSAFQYFQSILIDYHQSLVYLKQ